jgi:MFS family permease
MASNDPTDTGGLFVGRRPGTRPVRFRDVPADIVERRKRRDRGLAWLLLAAELLVCMTIWGPQPALGLWFGSHVQYWTGSVTLAIIAAFVLMLITLFGTLMIARRIDHAWKLVRRAGGIRQERGALERIFVISLMIAGSAFLFWFMIIEGPGSSVFSPQAP